MISKKRLILGTLAIFLLGSGFHFLYELLGRSVLAAPFFAVNESIWEHLKLLSTAALLWVAADYFLADKCLRPCFFAVRAIALPIALISIPLLYYFIKGALGLDSFYIDIGLFLIASALYQYLAMRLEGQCARYSRYNGLGIAVLGLIFLLFVLFTFLPPHVPLFLDPPTGDFGITG
jgi:hypothetical protein